MDPNIFEELCITYLFTLDFLDKVIAFMCTSPRDDSVNMMTTHFTK